MKKEKKQKHVLSEKKYFVQFETKKLCITNIFIYNSCLYKLGTGWNISEMYGFPVTSIEEADKAKYLSSGYLYSLGLKAFYHACLCFPV